MSKYTEELKKEIVLEHKIKHYGVRVLQRKYGIPRSLIRQWTFKSCHSINFWNNKSRNNLCMAKEIYYRWYTSSISEARQVLKNAKEKFNTKQTKGRMDKR